MTQDDSVDQAIARIKAIDWELKDYRAASHIALLKEYLRRASLWATALDCADKWPFFDVAAQIDFSLRLDEAKVEALKRYLAPFPVSRTIRRMCEWFVHWAVVKNSPQVTKTALPDPYEPLILLYERGGDFYLEQGFFHFPVGCFPRGTCSQHYNLVPHILLDEQVLDRLDKGC
ncbi:hypothetical protein IC235_19375 [Hymenobacter sp. BT664]|uniref:Uncharacterized protein n=1 Tax=Hymenobacter montanus TaxID=2771359 RepID=A0A927BGX2_9BACT|nr:hypothetical protein [Hymenobacter montanus]MBD2770055.1 hypothetical protein [Hymenobacter montanus]